MSVAAVTATRLNLLRTRRKLAQLTKGTQLLRRKREALVTELFRLARPAADARERITALARESYPRLAAALAQHGLSGVRAISWPIRDYCVEVVPASVWGVVVSELVSRPPVRRTLGARGTSPAAAGVDTVRATDAFEELTDLLLDAAPREMLLRRVGQALAQTSRQVHTLERRVSPQLERDVSRVRRILEEREREERVRLGGLLRRRNRGGPSG